MHGGNGKMTDVYKKCVEMFGKRKVEAHLTLLLNDGKIPSIFKYEDFIKSCPIHKRPTYKEDYIVKHDRQVLRNMEVSDVLSGWRQTDVVDVRMVIMWHMMNNYRTTLKQVGAIFNGRDHSTVHNAVKTVEDKLFIKDKDIVELVNKIHETIN